MVATHNVKKEVGATKVAKGILGSLDRRLVEPAGLVVRSSGWILFAFILYMLWSGMFPEVARESIYIWLGVYAVYLLSLEFIRRHWARVYDTQIFRTTRILINLVVISALISVSSTGRSLVIFAYTVPIFASIVYFADHNWAKLTVGGSAVLGLYLAGIPLARDNRLTINQFLVFTVLLAVSGIGFELFRRRVNSGPARLTEIARELHKTLDLQKLMEDILKQAVKITQAQRGLIIVINPRNKRYVGHFMQNFALRANHSIEDLAGKCLTALHKQPFENADLHGAFNNRDIYNEFFESGARSVLAELLYDQTGQVIGVVTVASDDANSFDKISKNALREFGFLVSSAIDNCFRHREVTLREVRNREAGEKFVSAASEEEVIKTLIREVRQQIPHAEGVILHRYREDNDELVPICLITPEITSKYFEWSIQKAGEIKPLMHLGQGIAGHALEMHDTILVPDVDHHPWYVKNDSQGKTKSLLVAPLIDTMDNELYGTLSVQSPEPSAFNFDDETIITHLTTQASLAIAKFRDFQGWKEEGGTLRKILEQIRSFDISLSERELCEQIAQAAASLLGFKIARIRLLSQDDQLVTLAITGVSEAVRNSLINTHMPFTDLKPFLIPKHKVETSYLIRHGTAGWKQLVDKHFHTPSETMQKKNGWHAYDALISPLLDPSGNILGILTWDVPLTGLEPNKQTLELIGVFASAASWVIELSRTQRRLTDQQRRAQSFIDTISQELSKGRDLATICEVVVQVGAKLLSAEGCSLYLVRGNDIELVHSNYLANTDYILRRKPISAQPKSGLTAWVAATGSLLCFNNQEYKKHEAWAGEAQHSQYIPSKYCRSVLLAPVKDKDDKVIGVLTLENKTTINGPKDFDKADEQRLTSLANEFGKALEVIGLYEEIREWERSGMAEDLHDLINWYHSGVIMWIEAMEEWLKQNDIEKIKELMPELRRHAYTTVYELKTLHTNILTKSFEAATLGQVLQETMAVWSNRARPKYKEKMQITLDCPENIQIPVKLRNTIVRIALLAFSNAIQHSGITEDPNIKVLVSVQQTDNEVIVGVMDNGRGIDFDKTPLGFGFDRMRQLTEKINTWGEVKAALQIETGVNQGTQVFLHLQQKDK